MDSVNTPPTEQVDQGGGTMYQRVAATFAPHINPLSSRLAFGRRAVPRLCRELTGERKLERAALTTLTEYLRSPEHVVECVGEGMIQHVTSLILSGDGYVQARCAECLATLAASAIGRDGIVCLGVVAYLRVLLYHQGDAIRTSSHLVLNRLSPYRQGSEELERQGMVEVLVNQVYREEGPIRSLILDTLHNLARHLPQRCVDAGLLPAAAHLFLAAETSSSETLSAASRCVFQACSLRAAKEECLRLNLLEPLLSLAETGALSDRRDAVVAISSICTTTVAKLVMWRERERVVPALLHLMETGRPAGVVVAGATCLCVLSEHPEMRKVLRCPATLIFIEAARKHKDEAVQRVAKRCWDTVMWAV